MKNPSLDDNQKGFMLIGLSMAIVAIFTILIFAVQKNMNLFFENSNRSKAFYDAEKVIDQTAVMLREAYDIARPVGKDLVVPAGPIPPPTYLVPNLSYLRLNKTFYIPPNASGKTQFCMDRSDGFGKSAIGNSQICLDYGPGSTNFNLITVNTTPPTADWQQIKDAFQFAVDKLLLDLFGSPVAEAQELNVYKPMIPLASPKFILNINAAVTDPAAPPTPTLINSYNTYNCVKQPAAAKSPVSHCLTFQFCTSLRPCVKPADFVYQTIVFRWGPQSDIEN